MAKRKTTKQVRKPGPAGNWDYVKPGSDRHAGLLGLRKATDEDELQHGGWTLQDINMWGPEAKDRFIMNDIRSRVNELTSEPPEIQSEDPGMPGYAPPLDTRRA